jgi:hypothetical protein
MLYSVPESSDVSSYGQGNSESTNGTAVVDQFEFLISQGVKGSLMAHSIVVGDPSLRLKNGYAQDDTIADMIKMSFHFESGHCITLHQSRRTLVPHKLHGITRSRAALHWSAWETWVAR